MALTCYCKKCKADVPVGDFCPQCGKALLPSSRRVVWCIPHQPVKDWLCWNASARLVLPVWLLVYLLVLTLEGAAGGLPAVEALLGSGLTQGFVWMLVIYLLGLLLVLLLQGEDLKDCVVDSKGLHVQTWLPNPTPLKLLLRGKSPRLMKTLTEPNAILPLNQADIPYKDMARIQLWPEKLLILVYSPSRWLRLTLYCTPFSYGECLHFLRDKVGKKKNLLLPPELVAPPTPRKPKAPKAAAPVTEPAADMASFWPVMEEVPVEVENPFVAQEDAQTSVEAETETAPLADGVQGSLFEEMGTAEEVPDSDTP